MAATARVLTVQLRMCFDLDKPFYVRDGYNAQKKSQTTLAVASVCQQGDISVLLVVVVVVVLLTAAFDSSASTGSRILVSRCWLYGGKASERVAMEWTYALDASANLLI